jgi:hypothetical protein
MDFLRANDPRQVYQRHREFVWLLCLSASFRWMAVLFFSQGGYFLYGPAGHDFGYYWQFGEMALEGLYPSIHYWVEYPPVFTWALVGIHRLSLTLPAMVDHVFPFFVFLGGFMAIVETGNMTLIYAIECRLANRKIALRASWIYALLFAPLFVMTGWFDALPLFFLLLAVFGLATRRPALAGIAVAVGFWAKVLPAVVAPLGLRVFGSRGRLAVYIVSGLITVLAIALPFLLRSPSMLLATFQSAASRPPWETIWALLDDYYGPGGVAPLREHIDPATALLPGVHASTLPWPVIYGVEVVLYLIGLFAYRRGSPRAIVAICGFAVTLFLLFSKGYSFQFIVYLLPFVVLLFPNGRGVVLALLLTASGFLDFPIFHKVLPDDKWVAWVSIGGRAVLEAGLAATYLAIALPNIPVRALRFAQRAAGPVLVGACLFAIALAWPLCGAYYESRGQYYEMSRYIKPLSLPGQGAVLSHPQMSSYAAPFLNGVDFYVLPEDWEGRKEQITAQLGAFTTGRPQVWLIMDYAGGTDPRQAFLEQQLESYGAKATDRWFSTIRLVGYTRSQAGER